MYALRFGGHGQNSLTESQDLLQPWMMNDTAGKNVPGGENRLTGIIPGPAVALGRRPT